MGIHRQLPDRLRQLHPKYRTPWIGILLFGGRSRSSTILPGQADVPRQHVRVRRDAVVHDRARLGDPAAGEEAGRRAPVPRPGQRAHPRLRRCRCSRSSAGRAPRSRSSSIALLHPDRRRRRRRLARARHRRLRRLPPPAGARPHLHAQGGDRAAGGRPRGGVRLRARALRRQRLRRPGAGDRAQARGAQAPRHPRAGDDHGAELDGDRRADARPGRGRAQRHRGGEGGRRRARVRATSSACAPARPGGGSSRTRSTCARRRS